MKIASYSLDYVPSGSASPKSAAPSTLPDSAMNEAAVIYGQPILKALQQTEKKQMRFNDLIEKVNQEYKVSSFEEFQGVIKQLGALGLIRVVEPDLRGNHLIALGKSA